MANAALYRIITDKLVTLSFGDDIDYDTTFNLTQNLDANARSVLTGIIATLQNANNLTFEVEINNVNIKSYGPITGSERFNIQEVVKADLLKSEQI